MAVSLIEKIARAVFRSNFHPDEDEALVATLWNEWPDDRRDAERAAQAALTAIQDGGDGVQQCDREAAASGYFAWCSGNPVIPDKMKAGQADVHSMVQAFARHRSTAAAAERARIVAWLRGHEAFSHIGGKFMADAIERGEV